MGVEIVDLKPQNASHIHGKWLYVHEDAKCVQVSLAKEYLAMQRVK